MGERIVRDFAAATNTPCILLRYFNPVGAHETALIGELPLGTPDNLVPYITQTAIGKREKLTVFGNDYHTRDGSCIRDYIHVSDIANAHIRALRYLIEGRNEAKVEVFNLGTGRGTTVLEAVKAFEEASGQKLNYVIGPRRPGDVIEIYANNTLAKTRLGWEPKRDLMQMMRSAWAWEQRIAEREAEAHTR
jgi:UDP-glucose 4-epimerase